MNIYLLLVVTLLLITLLIILYPYKTFETFENNQNVLDYGVKGDGITDDTIAIQKAVNMLQNQTVIFPSGVYIISSAIVLPSNTNILGMQNVVIKLKDNLIGDIDSMFITIGQKNKNISIKNITIDGNRRNNIRYPSLKNNPTGTGETTPLCLISFYNTSNILIENCIIKNAMNSGCWIIDCDNITIQNCIFKYYRIQGVAMRNYITGTKNFKIINNYFGYPDDDHDKTDTSGGIVGIEVIFGASNGIIQGNHVMNNLHENCYPSWGWSGIYPNMYPLNKPTITTVPNQGDGAGIELSGVYSIPDGTAPPVNNIIISNNYLTKNQVGIRAEQASQNITISGNITTENIKYGIYLYSSKKIIVNSNIISNNGLSGISIQDASGQIQPSTIQITSNYLDENLQNAIEVRACNGCNISNNTLSNHPTGIHLYDSPYKNIFCTNILINLNTYNNIQNTFLSDKSSTNSTIINLVNLTY